MTVRKSHDWKEIALPSEARLQPANLFAALDLDRPGLEAVKARVEKGDEPGALKALLAYYRARTNVWVPIVDALKIEKPAPAETLGHADDLLRHVFLARPNMRDLGYTPQNYGPDINWSSNPVDDVSWLSCMHRFDWDTYLASAFLATTNDRFATGLLAETLGRQFTADGVQREWSINYHMACAGLLLNVAEFLRRNGSEAPSGFMDAIGRMYDYLFAALSPDRLYPMFSDARRPGHDIAGALRRGATVFDRPQYLAVLEDGTNGCPKQLSYAFPEAGMYYLRSGWERGAIYAAFHCSPKAASSHDQPDNGTFELFAHGRWIMPDSGCYAYGHGTEFEAERPWFCSTVAHQTLTLDGKNSINASRHRLWHDEPRHTALAFENGSYPGWTHRRTVFFVARSFLVLVDEALGEPRGTLDLRFQLAPGPAVLDATNRTARTAFLEGGNVLVWTPPDAPVALIEEKGQTSSKFHVKEARPAFAYRHRAQGPAIFLTVIAPFEGDRVPLIESAFPEMEPGADRIEVGLKVNGVAWTLGRDLASGDAWCR